MKKLLFLLALCIPVFAQPPGGGGGVRGDGIWRRDAIFEEIYSLDNCLGHQPPTGEYHYHANPVCLRASLDDNIELVRTKRTGSTYRLTTGIRSGFRLRNMTTRTSLPAWSLSVHPGVSQTLAATQYGPPVSSQFPLGRYIEDWEHDSTIGDLDQYNGRTGVTPEFPNGTYAYFVTINEDGSPAFPYMAGSEYYGNVTINRTVTVPDGVALSRAPDKRPLY